MNEFRTGGYCPVCLHTTAGCTCMETMSNLIKKSMKDEKLSSEEIEGEINRIEEEEKKAMEDMKLDLETAIEYFTERRNDSIEHFNDVLKANNYTRESIHQSLDIVLRANEQLKTLEDCLVVYRIAKANQ
jgi:hypothetical protein